MYSDILGFVRTNLERDILLNELEQIKIALFEPKAGVEQVLKSSVCASHAAILREKSKKEENFASYIEGLIKELTNMDEVKIELPQEPTEGLIDIVYGWLTKNVSPNVIISVSVNPAILGGATISYKGKYYDGSLSRILDEVISNEKLQILSR